MHNHSFKLFTGVPCSYLKDLINYAVNTGNYIAAANEGDAIAIAAGAYLGGEKAVVLMQNSGLTNAISPLTSLSLVFQLPVLGFISLRGEINDEPQHELMGQITTQMLTLIGVEWDYLSTDLHDAKLQLARASKIITSDRSYFFIVRKGTFSKHLLVNTQRQLLNRQNKYFTNTNKNDMFPSRYEALKKIVSLRDSKTIFIATTGKAGRELYDIADLPNNFYMVGSMGCASSIGFGLAYTRKDCDVIVIDGDGSLLMRLGSLAVNGYYRPPNLLHVLLDNNSHDSTGGQYTVSDNVAFAKIASACGYPASYYANDLEDLELFIAEWKRNKILSFIMLKVRKGSKEPLGRPNIKPYEVKERLVGFIHG